MVIPVSAANRSREGRKKRSFSIHFELVRKEPAAIGKAREEVGLVPYFSRKPGKSSRPFGWGGERKSGELLNGIGVSPKRASSQRLRVLEKDLYLL